MIGLARRTVLGGRRMGARLTVGGIQARYRAADLALADGAAVASWPDTSGRATVPATQATAAARPTFVASALNARPAVRFDGAAQFLQFTAAGSATLDWFSGVAGNTVVVVARTTWDPGSGEQSLLHVSPSDNNYEGRWRASLASSNDATVGQHRFLTTVEHSSPYSELKVLSDDAKATTNQWFTYTATASWAGGRTSIHADGTYVGWAAMPPRATTDTATSQTATIGRKASEAGDWFKGDIAEIIVFDHPLTAAEREQVHAYIRSYYALTVATQAGDDDSTDYLFTQDWVQADGTAPAGFVGNGDPTGGYVEVHSNSAQFRTGSSTDGSATQVGRRLNIAQVQDLDVLFDWDHDGSPMWAWFVVRDQTPSPAHLGGYMIVLPNDTGFWEVLRGDGAGNLRTIPGGDHLTATFTANYTYRVRLNLRGARIRAKVWPADQAESLGWAVDYTDTAPIIAGYTSVVVDQEGGQSGVFNVENMSIIAVPSTSTLTSSDTYVDTYLDTYASPPAASDTVGDTVSNSF